MALLIQDRPNVTLAEKSGLIITEVNQIYIEPDTVIHINGLYVSGSVDQIALYNSGAKTKDITGWVIDFDSGAANYTAPATTTIAPGAVLWLTGNFTADAGTNTTKLYAANFSTVIDQINLTTTAGGEKFLCLPDGKNTRTDNPQGGGTPYSSGIGRYRWVTGGQFGTTAGAPATTADTNGEGVWLDQYKLRKSSGTIGYDSEVIFSDSEIFLHYDSSIIIRSNINTWQWSTVDAVVSKGPADVTNFEDTVVWMDSTSYGADSTAFFLFDPTSSIVSVSGTIDLRSDTRWVRASTTDPLAFMATSNVSATPLQALDAAYVFSTTPFISEIFNAATRGGPGTAANHVVISQLIHDADNTGIMDAIELYNPTGSAISLNNWWVRSNAFPDFQLNPAGESIAAYGFYLITDDDWTVGGIRPTADHLAAGNVYINNDDYVSINNSADLSQDSVGYGAATLFEGTVYPTNMSGSSNDCSLQRKATLGSDATSMASGGSDVNNGNGYDSNDNSVDFVRHTSISIINNSASATEAPLGGPTTTSGVSANEFVEISITKPIIDLTFPDRKYEFIEIQNPDSEAINLVTGDYWISGDATTPTTKRRIYPIYGASNSLAASAVGVIVAVDAETPLIASWSSKTTSQINWYGLGPSSGSAVDTLLVTTASAQTDIPDNAWSSLILGFGTGGVPSAASPAPHFYGIAFPTVTPNANPAVDSSWQKISLGRLDDSTSPFDTILDATLDANNYNWQRKSPTPGIGLSLSGRQGIDGAPQGASDTWYMMNFDSYVLFDTAGGYDVYYRTRVFDEGGKINLNAIAGIPGNTERYIFSYLLQTTPNPPFQKDSTKWPYASTDADNLLADVLQLGDSGAGFTTLITPASVYTLWNDVASPIQHRHFDTSYFPYQTIYGKSGGVQVNVNTAETPALRAAFRWALAHDAATATSAFGLALAPAIIRAEAMADSLYTYLTGGDSSPYDDTIVSSLGDIPGLFSGATGDAAAATWANGAGRFTNILHTASSNYFMVYSTGFVHKKGDDPLTQDPIAQARILAVLWRSSSEDKGEIVFWREGMEFANQSRTMTFPLGTNRYPEFRWDKPR